MVIKNDNSTSDSDSNNDTNIDNNDNVDFDNDDKIKTTTTRDNKNDYNIKNNNNRNDGINVNIICKLTKARLKIGKLSHSIPAQNSFCICVKMAQQVLEISKAELFRYTHIRRLNRNRSNLESVSFLTLKLSFLKEALVELGHFKLLFLRF